jgi:TatD-related deoxyribonuclease
MPLSGDESSRLGGSAAVPTETATAEMWDGERWTGPIYDGHFHLDRSGRYLAAVRDFVNTGGTGLCLVHKPSFDELPETIEAVESAYADTIEMAEEVRSEFGILVRVILGPHPVVWAHQLESLGDERATELHLRSVDAAIGHCEVGVAVAVGEVGRPHYPMPEQMSAAADELFEEVLRRCAKAAVPVQLHLEDDGITTTKSIAQICDAAGMPRNRTVRHFAPPDISTKFTQGIACSVNMGRDSVVRLVESIQHEQSFRLEQIIDSSLAALMTPWHMETDHMDDARRPGAVLGPKTLPKRTHALGRLLAKPELQGGLGWSPGEVVELLWHLHHVWPTILYGEA